MDNINNEFLGSNVFERGHAFFQGRVLFEVKPSIRKDLGLAWAHWGHWDNSEAIPNGIVLRFHLAGWRQARMDGLVPIFLAMDQAAQSIKSQ